MTLHLADLAALDAPAPHTSGTPLIEIRTQFHKPATYGQTLTVHTEITEFSRKTLTHRHQVKRGDEKERRPHQHLRISFSRPGNVILGSSPEKSEKTLTIRKKAPRKRKTWTVTRKLSSPEKETIS